jgi:hypothetical protein
LEARRHAHFSVDPGSGTIVVVGRAQGDVGELDPDAHDKHNITYEAVGKGRLTGDDLGRLATAQHQYRNENYSRTKTNTAAVWQDLPARPHAQGDKRFIDLSGSTLVTTQVSGKGFRKIEAPERDFLEFVPKENGQGHHLVSPPGKKD